MPISLLHHNAPFRGKAILLANQPVSEARVAREEAHFFS